MYKFTVYEILSARPFFRKVDEVKAMSSESARRKAIIGTNAEYSKTCTMQEKKESIRKLEHLIQDDTPWRTGN